MGFICYKWEECDIKWEQADWKWEECRFVEELLQGYGAAGEDAWQKYLEDPVSDEDKRKRKILIRLIAKVKNEPKYDEEKELRKDIKISVKDIKTVIKEMTGIDLDISVDNKDN